MTRPMSLPKPKRISIRTKKPNTVVMALAAMALADCTMASSMASWLL